MPDRKARPVRIALIQQAGLLPDPAMNKAELCETIDRLASDADFVMATELSTTPYFGIVHDRSLQTWAEKIDGSFLTALQKIAARRQTTILSPVYLDCEDGTFANVVIVFGPDGKVVKGKSRGRDEATYFTKVHLPSAWRDSKGIDEPFYFRRGDSFPVFATPKAHIGILVCYDRRFPEAWRSLALSGAELVFMPSCVPAWSPSQLASTGDMFVSELQTRACENGVFVAACNRAGGQSLQGIDTNFVGRSCVIDPAGGLLGQLSEERAGHIVIDIDVDNVRRVRRRLPLLSERQTSAYDLEDRRPNLGLQPEKKL